MSRDMTAPTDPTNGDAMKIRAVLFDLDGTLLPMDQDLFIKTYLKLLTKKLAGVGYDPTLVVPAVLKGTDAMIANDGKRINEEVFWENFCPAVGRDALLDRDVFEDFYKNDFDNASAVTRKDPMARKIIDMLKARGIQCVLATNPVFPAVATEHRIRWAGLEPEDFTLYTTFENVGFAKPNPDYYRDILKRIGLCAEECIMVGNDVDDDMVAEKTGMGVFLLTDNLINRGGKDISRYPSGDFSALAEFLDTVTG